MLSAPAKAELERLFADEEDYLTGMTPEERRAVLGSHNWRDYLEKFAGTDASSNAMTESAIEEAHRSVHSPMAEDAELTA